MGFREVYAQDTTIVRGTVVYDTHFKEGDKNFHLKYVAHHKGEFMFMCTTFDKPYDNLMVLNELWYENQKLDLTYRDQGKLPLSIFKITTETVGDLKSVLVVEGHPRLLSIFKNADEYPQTEVFKMYFLPVKKDGVETFRQIEPGEK
ncbi:MAG: hypothetical protein V4439_01385 [Patescibacteria group bacterium]